MLDIFSNLVELHISTSVLTKGFWGCLSAVLSQGCVYTVMEWSGQRCVRTPEGSFKVMCKFSIVVLLNNFSAFPAFDPITDVLCVKANRNLGNTMWCYVIEFSESCEWNCVLIVGNSAGMHKQYSSSQWTQLFERRWGTSCIALKVSGKFEWSLDESNIFCGCYGLMRSIVWLHCATASCSAIFKVLDSVKNGLRRIIKKKVTKSHCGFWYSVAPGKQGDDIKLGCVFRLVFWQGKG